MSRLKKTSVAVAVLFCMTAYSAGAETPESGWPRVCKNPELLKAIRIIDSACSEIKCDAATLQQLDTRVDKPTLLAALRDEDLNPIHIFFESGQSELHGGALHWSEWKRDQVASLKFMSDPTNAVVFVLGQASVSGSNQHNFELSQRRMISVMRYIQDVLKIKCRAFHGGWLGEDIFQLTPSDARVLNIDPSDFDSDELKLNQAVHIFVFPCAPLL
jgi:hypothetical protein